MPILYVHGVATRDSLGFVAMTPYLRRLVAPAMSDDPDGVSITEVFWGGSGATFAWDGRSRPKSRLLGQGAVGGSVDAASRILSALIERESFDRLPDTLAGTGTSSGLISGGVSTVETVPGRLSSLTDDQLSDVLGTLIFATIQDEREAAMLALAADAIARNPDARDDLVSASTAEAEAAVIVERLEAAARAPGALVAQGSGVLTALRDRLGEALSRGLSLPAYTASILTAELRPGINELASLFLGDVFVYLAERDAPKPGDIATRVLEALSRAHAEKVARNEPLVVITHSMGGQLIYDAITYYLPNDAALKHIRIDFWCATASQVGFFEELKLFRLKNPKVKYPDKMPFPHGNLGVWWNVWDANDFLSFTADPIFEGVDDEPYDSGLSLVAAHSGYLKRASFFNRLAARLTAASGGNWVTP